jgi:hypothetical protein
LFFGQLRARSTLKQNHLYVKPHFYCQMRLSTVFSKYLRNPPYLSITLGRSFHVVRRLIAEHPSRAVFALCRFP